MQPAPDLGIPEVKPAIESIRGTWEQKMSPRRRHALLQGRLCALLAAWAADRGEVGSEWRFYFLERDVVPSSLVPDVAYVSFERLPKALGELREQPTIAPDIAIEILSPGDRLPLLHEKIAMYFAGGARGIVVVDPATRSLECFDGPTSRSTFGPGQTAVLGAYADLAIDVSLLFDRID